MPYEIQIAESLEDVSAADWDRLNIDSPFTSWRWVRLYPQILKAYRPLFILLYDNGELVGRAIMTLMNEPGIPIQAGLGRTIVKAILGRFPLMVCQTPLASLGGFSLPAGDEQAALQALFGGMRQAASAHHVSFTALGWLDPERKALVETLDQFAFVPMEHTTTLPIIWSDFDSYLADQSKSMRKDMNRHTNRARDMNIRIERSHDFAQYADRLHELVFNVERQHGSLDMHMYTDQVFEVAQRDLAENSVMLLGFAEDKLAGCGLLIHDQGTMILAMLGLDYEVKYLYFQMFYEAIRYAIEQGIAIIRGGSGAYDFKRRLGFRDEPTYVAYTSHRAPLRWLGTRLAGAVEQAEEQA